MGQPLKLMFDSALVQRLAERISAVYPAFSQVEFVAIALSQLDAFEFKGRVRWLAECLQRTLPPDYPRAIAILLASLPPDDGSFFQGDASLWVIEYFVAQYGLNHLTISINAMREITKRNTAEFAIRPFIVRYPSQLQAILAQWVLDDDPRIRRLVSEGTRPRLPWSMRLEHVIKDPSSNLPLLSQLKDDPSDVVRKSVANHLNDISKDHPQLVIKLCEAWMKDATDRTQWIIRHALRTLIKAGDPQALGIIGYNHGEWRLHNLEVSAQQIRLGDTLMFCFSIENTGKTEQPILIDYLIHHRKSDGITSPKVFKLLTRKLRAGERLFIQKKHHFRPITTRRYYSGMHRLEIQVNGQIMDGIDFLLST